MNPLLVSLRSIVLFTVILGGIYPVLITFLGGTLSSIRSHGSLLKDNEKVIGSELIGQKFTKEGYFWSRPSAADYDPMKSSASQRSGTDLKLKSEVIERSERLGEKVPLDLIYASGSGLDPHISPEAAQFQKKRIALARRLDEKALDKLILNATEERFLGFMGRPRVNVLELNMSLDKMSGVYGKSR